MEYHLVFKNPELVMTVCVDRLVKVSPSPRDYKASLFAIYNVPTEFSPRLLEGIYTVCHYTYIQRRYHHTHTHRRQTYRQRNLDPV